MATKQVSISRAEHRTSPSHEVRDGWREQIPLRDLSECLLAAYERVSRRALWLNQARGVEAGRELEDWKEAERDLLGAMPVDLAESEENFYALASVPGYSAAEISVAVEDRWLLISGYGHCFGQAECAAGGVAFDESELMSTYGEASAADSAVGNASRPSRLQSSACAEQNSEDCVVRRPFCVVELGSKVDAARSCAVLANGMVAVRMTKAAPQAPTEDNNVPV